MVNTEPSAPQYDTKANYNILNIVVNTERDALIEKIINNYNILNIVVNTEQCCTTTNK